MLYLTLRQYEYTVCVADHGSLTAAAGALNVSQPSLSIALTRLEDRLGQKLFDRRKGATLTITPFGHQFIAKARTLLDLAHDLETSPQQNTPFRIGFFEDIAPWHLAPVLDHLREHVPNQTFEAQTGRFSDLRQALGTGEIDLALTYDIAQDGPFHQHRLRQIQPVAFLACTHPLAQHTAPTLADLAAHPLILFNEPESQIYLQNLFERLNLQPKIAQRTSSLEMMRSMAAHGYGIGISYSHPPGNSSYDGKPLITRPIATPEAAADLVLLWSALRPQDSLFTKIRQTLCNCA
jgi:DNA-binding transcriptional LysR family regulator